MPQNHKSKLLQFEFDDDDDDDFQNPNHSFTQTLILSSLDKSIKNPKPFSQQPLKPISNRSRSSSKKPKRSICAGKENVGSFELLSQSTFVALTAECSSRVQSGCALDGVSSTFDEALGGELETMAVSEEIQETKRKVESLKTKEGFEFEKGYLSNSIESRLIASRKSSSVLDSGSLVDFEAGIQLNVLMDLCSEVGERENLNVDENYEGSGLVECPLCGVDISGLSEEQRHSHTNDCLDRDDVQKVIDPIANKPAPPHQVVDVFPVLEWLRGLGLSRYEEVFTREEVDWDTLQWLSEEDLFSIGVDALGPRKKIVHALNELKKANKNEDTRNRDVPQVSCVGTKNLAANKLITEYFPGSSVVDRNKGSVPSRAQPGTERNKLGSGRRKGPIRNHVKNRKVRDAPMWCRIPGTPFQVDAFRYLRGDCSHWFLTHFHMDHYQGLTRSFSHGKVYCSLITARLVNTKIGIPFDKLEILPLNQKISIAGVDVTCLDANHCPGAIIILFEPPNGKAILHTGDFRFCKQMTEVSVLKSCPIQTLILDTTYCNPQYDFPEQESVIQFVIEAIQAEAFNPRTLFLIGSYTIGKERLFLEVARFLRKKVYVGAPKLRLLECLGLPEEDMQWLTLNEQESHIHVVPMWTIASFKRMKHISNQYSNRFNLIIAFSPSGWTFGKGKKTTPGRRCQQGTIIRYEVPYSEHSSFIELKEFVKFISPENIVPSVNNDSPESADAMLSLLKS
ncbi:hypothetical protein GIB67_040789 [Kingdonia uniflora]|uniref:SAM domain-containing protein n=1 Tax=Kingdonia uniflora TaxID=39325 RepID=A0A7J7P4B6_9MAGN|nr:hypothetical protein GIB67_040789 [Kingdonia uniflora]